MNEILNAIHAQLQVVSDLRNKLRVTYITTEREELLTSLAEAGRELTTVIEPLIHTADVLEELLSGSPYDFMPDKRCEELLDELSRYI